MQQNSRIKQEKFQKKRIQNLSSVKLAESTQELYIYSKEGSFERDKKFEHQNIFI